MRLLVVLASCLCLSVSAPAGSLQDEVKGLVKSIGPRKGTVAVSVRDDQGQEVVNIRGDAPLMPASNQKLLTTGAALRILGPDFTFQTRLVHAGDRLVVVGDGDPAFGDPELLGDCLGAIDQALEQRLPDPGRDTKAEVDLGRIRRHRGQRGGQAQCATSINAKG